MALSELKIVQFRSHRATRLTLDGRPIAIWGANGSGKTNILEAVSLLSPGRGLRRAAAEDMTRRPGAPGWKVSAVIGGHDIETWAEEASRLVRIDGKAATQAALARVTRILWLVPAMDRLWIEPAEGRRRFLDRMTMSFLPDHAEAVLAYERAMRERNRLLRDQVADPAWYGALEAQMSEAGARIVANRAEAVARITEAQSGATSAFPAADLSIQDPDSCAGSVGDLAQALAASRRRDMAAGRSLVGPHRADLLAVWAQKAIPAAQSSTGEQKALLISLVLANARAIAADGVGATVLLLDEVAAHLDAGRRAALYDEVCAMGVQALMTGTEADLFAPLGARAQGLELSESGGASVVVSRDLPGPSRMA